MSFYLYTPAYGFMPYLYGQYLQNECNMVYNPVPLTVNNFIQGTEPEKVEVNNRQENDYLAEEEEEGIKNESEDEIRSEKKNRAKKRRGIDKEKELESAKKNSESNIINQFFSYFSSRSQSEEIVLRAIMLSVGQIEEEEKIISIFYNIMKCMSMQRIKKYVNKKTLLNIFSRENIEKEIPEILEKFNLITFVTIDEITEVIRRCCFYYLRNISLVSILASKRISALSKKEHLKKRKQLSNVVMGKI